MSAFLDLLFSSVGIYAAAAIAAAFALLKAYSSGRAAERAKQTQDSLEALRARNATDEKVENMSADERHRRLSRWVSD